jgi:hypothetical protein
MLASKMMFEAYSWSAVRLPSQRFKIMPQFPLPLSFQGMFLQSFEVFTGVGIP